MATSDVISQFNTFAFKSAAETLKQQTEAFNEASSGALTLEAKANSGDLANNGSFAAIADAMRRRDVYGSGSVAPKPLQMMNEGAVRVAGGSHPIEFAPAQLQWIMQSPEEGGVAVGEMIAQGMLADELNAAITCAVAAVGGNADAVHDGTAEPMSLQALLKGAAKFGDQANSLRAWVIHSAPMHSLLEANVANANNLFSFGTVNVMADPLGRVFVVTDSPALTYEDTGTFYNTLGLVQGGVRVEDAGDLFTNVQTVNGSENIKRSLQAEYTFNVGVKGFSYTGTGSPTDAQLGTAANWSKVATYTKSTGGVLVKSK